MSAPLRGRFSKACKRLRRGGYTEISTGLYKLGARYYDPIQDRFTQTDPPVFPGDINQASL